MGGRDRLADLGDPLLDLFFAAAVVLMQELAQSRRRRLLQLLQGGPARQQLSHQGGGGVVKPAQDLGKDLFEPAGELLRLAGVLVDQLAPLLGEELQTAGLHRVRLQTAEVFGVFEQQVQNQLAVGRVALGAGGRKGLAIVGQGGGVDREQDDVRILGKGADHRSARLFHGHGHGPAAVLLSQSTGPDLHRFRGAVHLAMFLLAVGGEHTPVVFLIGPVQTDPCCVVLRLCTGCCVFHHGCLHSGRDERAGRTLSPRRPYSRV